MNCLDDFCEWFESLSEEDQLYYEYGWFTDGDDEPEEDCVYTVCKE